MSTTNLLRHKTKKILLLCLRSLLFSTLIVSIIFSIPLPKIWASNITWIGGTDTNWSTAANWSTGTVPTSSDDVLIDSNVTVNLTSTTTVRSLTLGNSAGTTTPILNFNYDAITNGGLIIDGGNLQTYSGSQITHTAATLGTIVGRIKILVLSGDANIQGAINVNNKGYAGGNVDGANGYGTGGGVGWFTKYSTGGAGGAGHASPGAAGTNSAGGIVYQSLRTPTDLGSGGGRGYSYSNGTGAAGAGGGNVYLYANGNLAISGNISADGQAGAQYSGGGSGGSIYLHGTNVSLSSTISASGASGGTSAGAGSSGRVLIEYTGTYSNTGNISISTGSGYGTAYLYDLTNNDIIIPVNNGIWYSGHLDSWNFRNLYINGNVTFKPSSTTLFTINTSEDLVLADNTTLFSAGYYTSDTDGVGVYYNIAGDLQIPNTAKISGDGLGYIGGYSTTVYNGRGDGKGLGVSNHNYGNVTGSGGGHGGTGGSGGAGAGGTTYDSIGTPMKLGSGGGFGNSYLNPDGAGGKGGSAIKINVGGTTQLDGTLSANGTIATAIGGGGSGGSIYLITDILAGAGTISATGGSAVSTTYGVGGAGGGGRISIAATSSSWTGSSFLASVATARGSIGNAASDGTVYIAPIFSTISSSAITSSSATLTGTISNIEGGATDRGFEYSINSDFSSSTQISKGEGSASEAISADLSSLTDATTYYYRLYATVQGATAYSQAHTFTTLLSNTAPTAQASNLSGATNLYAGKTIDLVARYSDPDGYADLGQLHLYLKNPDGTDIKYYATSTGVTLTDQTPTEISGGEYIDSLTYDITVNTPTSNDITLVWHITPKWNWAQSVNIQYGVKTIDTKAASSSEEYLTNKYIYENRLTMAGSLTVTDKNGSSISSGNWTYPNSDVTFSGIKVIYYGTSNIYPEDSDFDVTITNTLSQSSTDTTSSGENISIIYKTPDGTNTDIVYTVSLTNLSTGASDQSTSTTFTLKTDKTVPTIDSLSSSTYLSKDKWYSSSSNTFTWTTSEVQSGIQGYWYLVDTNPEVTSNTLISTGTKIVISSIAINNIPNGISYFHILAKDNTDNISSITTYTLKKDSTTPDIGNITGLYNGIWQNIDSGPTISWTDPVSASNDTFYITNDGSDPSSTNYTYSTTAAIFNLPNQQEGETIIKVRAQTGAGAYSKIKTFIIRYDKTAPANASSFSASTSGENLLLAWQNPTIFDFNRVIIIRNESHIPSNLLDGVKVYEGNENSYTDEDIKSGHKYYYTIYTIDNVGNVSSGSVISHSMDLPEVPIVPAITEDTKVVSVNQLESTQTVSISAKDKPVFTTTNSNVVNVYSSDTINIEVPAETIINNTTSIEKVLLVVNDEIFHMLYDSVRNIYKATISTPSIKGTYDTTIQTVSADNTSEFAIKLSLKVDPHGYVYYKIGKDELRISNAKVSLYQKVDDKDVLWIADDGTANPQYTNQTGEYSFFVEPGIYKIITEADGYKTIETEWFTVETNIIEKNIQMSKSILLPVILGGAGIIALGSITYLIIRKKRKS